MSDTSFTFEKSKPAFFIFMMGGCIALLFAYLNFKHDDVLIGSLFVIGACIFCFLAFLKHKIEIKIPTRVLRISYSAFDFPVCSKSYNIPEKGSLIFRDQGTDHKGNLGYTYSLHLLISDNETDEINNKTAIYYTEKHSKEERGIEKLIEIANCFIDNFGFKVHDKTSHSRSHWRKYKRLLRS